ncbi:MAG: hypothetical protein A3G81_13685 [Betaproteobacteria bacterium RIFCSPLOWO2_12_FULL_65_14]|nr:MAG: hypothetical protein A3G81_13685 [Betaproteobacteria bacterium RIFCSPLOWO2_12_FULL_65_14]
MNLSTALVALDLSPAEEPMTGCLGELLDWGVRKLVLAHVIRVGYVEGAGYGHEEEHAAWLERRAAPLREAGFEVAVRIRDSGDPAAELLQLAREEGAGLVVIGSRSHSLVHDLFLGSVAREVIRKASIPVLLERIEPTGEATEKRCRVVCRNKLQRVLVVTDLSPAAEAAVEAGAYLAGRSGGADLLAVLPEKELAADTGLRRKTLEALERYLARIRDAGGDGRAIVEAGDPAQSIARIADSAYSLLVVGKHGRNWIESMVIGSTAMAVSERARIPVLVVPGR